MLLLHAGHNDPVRKLLDISFVVVGVACALYALVWVGSLPRRVWERRHATDTEQAQSAAEFLRKR